MTSDPGAPQLAMLLLALALLVLAARTLGGAAARWGQPAVLGEVAAGVLLGATVFGRWWSSGSGAIFAGSGERGSAFSQVSQLAIVFFMLAAGMELNLGLMWRERRRSLAVSCAGLIVPFALGLVCAWWGFDWLRGEAGSGRLQFSLFFATALSISALPVIVKILGDLGLLGSRLAAIIIASAVVDDLAGWALLGMAFALGSSGEIDLVRASGAAAYTIFMLSMGPRVLQALLAGLAKLQSAQGAELALVLAITALAAAAAEWLGLHAVFGGFLAGICINRSPALDAFTRRALGVFGTQVCAPLFFATIAINVDLAREFDLALTLVVFAVASLGKVLGCSIAARLAGVAWRDSLAVAFSMNARGAIEIVFGQLALEQGLIDERLFIALVTMALATSAVACSVLRVVTAPSRSVELGSGARPAAV